MLIIIIIISFLFTFCITQLMRTWRYKATLCKILVSLRLIAHFLFVRVSLECYSTYSTLWFCTCYTWTSFAPFLTDSHFFFELALKAVVWIVLSATNSHDYQATNNDLVALIVLIAWLMFYIVDNNAFFCNNTGDSFD